MRIDGDLLAILACPACRAPLRVDEPAAELACTGCGLVYPVRDDIPVLLVDQASEPQRPDKQSSPEPADGQ